MELEVINIEGQETGKKAILSDAIFGIEPNDHAIYLDTKHYMNNNRQGTHKAKERGEITGSTRKIKKQKGTGTARAGSIKSPVFRGGGRVFGPRPRDYEMKLNKKVKQLARKSALTYKAKDEGIIVIEDFTFDEPKTKYFENIKINLDIDHLKSLLVLPQPDYNIYLSSRNLWGSDVIVASELNTYKILDNSVLIFLESSLKELNKQFLGENFNYQETSTETESTTSENDVSTEEPVIEEENTQE